MDHYFEIVIENEGSKEILRFEDITKAESYAEEHFGRQLICFVPDEKHNALLIRVNGIIPYERYQRVAVA